MDQILDEKTAAQRKDFFANTLDRLRIEFNEEDRYHFLNELKQALYEANECKIKSLVCESEELAIRAKILSEYKF